MKLKKINNDHIKDEDWSAQLIEVAGGVEGLLQSHD